MRRLTRPAGDRDRPLVIAHRGGAGLRPENTLAAFEHAVSLGVDALELDVRRSADDVAVVHHDATLDRTTGTTGPVRAHTADELARLDAAFHFGAGLDHPFRGLGIGVPRLREVLDRWPEVPVIVELKGDDLALAGAVLDAVRDAGALERVCLGGFSRRLLQAVRQLEPRVPTGAAREEVRWALYASWLGLGRRRVPYRAYQVPEVAGRTRVVSPRFVRLAHRLGLPVHVWTVDEPAQARRLLEWGVDGLISDRPDVALHVRDAWEQGQPGTASDDDAAGTQ